MEIQTDIVNKVAQSGLITIDLANYKDPAERVLYDIKDNLFHGLILKEKDFRDFVAQHDWSVYEGKHVAIICSTDAIVPTWAYMLLANKLEPYAKTVIYGDLDELDRVLFHDQIKQIDMEAFKDQRVVIKGCGDIRIPESAFIQFTTQLSKVAKSIMYGEPCSTVPIFKRKK